MEQNEKKTTGINISTRSYVTSLIIIFALMLVTYLLTFLIPSGMYTRVISAQGNPTIDTAVPFQWVDRTIPFYKWILSPFLVLGADGGGTLLAVLAFLLVVGGAFSCLDSCGLLNHMLQRITHRFGKTRYRLMTVVVLFFMALGALVGSFEEVIPLVPIVVTLAVALGWDVQTGLAMSMLAVSCGFASGVMNPFTVGVAQSLAGIPMFSGIWLRIVSFLLIFPILLFFIRRHARRIERPVAEAQAETYLPHKSLDRALIVFAAVLGTGILFIFLSGIVTVFQDYTMIVVALMFLAAGISAPLTAGMKGRELAKQFGRGIVSILPAVLMILMASSIRYTLEEASILDTILHWAVGAAGSMPKVFVILFIYLLVLIMNFFIGSGSAKAFMLIPLIIPLAQIFGISGQLCILAFAFGDGFSNVFYPTNAGLLISLGLADLSYTRWVRYSFVFQLMNLILTSLILMAGLAIGY